MGTEHDDEPGPKEVTHLLQSLPLRESELYDVVYSHLKTIARNRLSTENRDKCPQTTALVHEAYLKVSRQDMAWRDRRHFYGVAAEAMRRILVDDARNRNRVKRGAGQPREPLSGIALPECEWEADLLELDELLMELQLQSPENAEIVQLKFFSGLTNQECAEVLQISRSSVERRWRFARAWLRSKMLNEE